MSQIGLEDSKDPWKHVIAVSKFIILAIDVGLIKSFGVLIPEMVSRYNSDYKTMAFICGLPAFIHVASPISYLLTKMVKRRRLGMFGGVLTAVSLACAPLTDSFVILAIMLVLAGIGINFTYVTSITALNEFFPKTFVFANTITQFGAACGAFAMPVIIERSLEAYGYQGAFLILGGISLHAVVCGACLREPKDLHHAYQTEEKEKGETDKEEQGHSPGTIGDHLSKSKEECLLQPPKIRDRNHQMDNDADAQTPSLVSKVMQWLKTLTVVKEPMFSLILPAIFLEGCVTHAWMLFLAPHAEYLGIPRSQAVLLSTVAGISGIFGKICYLVLLHFNVNTTIITFLSCMVCATSFFLDPVSSTFASLAAMATVQGFNIFLLDAVPPGLLKLSVKSERNVPGAIPILVSVTALGIISGDVMAGHIFDISSSCSTLFISQGIIFVAVLVNLIIFIFVDKYFKRNMHL